MKNQKINFLLTLVFMLVLGTSFSSSTATGKDSKGNSEKIPPNIVYQLPDSAKISKVSFFIKEFKGAPRLHMEIGIRNVSDQMKRYRVHILLPEGPAVGGLYPRRTKKAKGIAAGAELSQVFPMYHSQMPSGFTISVKELN